LLVVEHESLCAEERVDFMFLGWAESHAYLDYPQHAYDVRSFIGSSPVMVGFHLVAKCLRALSESQRVICSWFRSCASIFHLLVVGASCHLPDLDRHHVCFVRWELRLYQGRKIEVDHGQMIFTCITVFTTHILRNLSHGLEECIFACGHVIDGSLQVFTASFEVSLSWSWSCVSSAMIIATVRLSIAHPTLSGRVLPSFTIFRHDSVPCCLQMLKQQIGVRFTVLLKQQ
jgi:hypothetical protein